jgi:hypothetical protein
MEFWIFKPSKWQKRMGFTISTERCRYSVWQDFSNYQCTRKAKIFINDYGFCKQHAKKIQERLDKEEE